MLAEFRVMDNEDLSQLCTFLKEFVFSKTSMVCGYIKWGSERKLEARVDGECLSQNTFRLKMPRHEKFVVLNVSDAKEILKLEDHFKWLVQYGLRWGDRPCRCASNFPKYVSSCGYSGF